MGTLLTAANWPIIGEIAWVLGKVMNLIYNTLDNMLPSDHGLIGWSIIIYTIIVYTLMLPLTVKQQRTSKMTALMNPELQAIQKKYKNKKDQASMLKQQEEMQQVYDKYGTSMMGGCLPMLIQMPLLFALYPVIYDMERYVPSIKNAAGGVKAFLTIPDVTMSPSQIMHARDTFEIAPAVIIITCIALPAISAITQYGSVRLSQAVSGQQIDKDNPMAGTMKSMNIMMPLFSLWMVFSLSAGIGLYWIFSAVIRCIQTVAVNKYLKNISPEELIEKNKEKAAKKRQKRGEKAEKINAMAQANTRSISSSARKEVVNQSEKNAQLKAAEEKRRNAKPGSLSAKANMVRDFNENKK
ncbi:MAG: YidC/Oxa1 family membrane protein insertase [Dorea sp.]|jgi:YidC/Oxa1 family membrane protein insertase|nr:YidC/Oxa1 family membrane protein insertase [Dorea sp.]